MNKLKKSRLGITFGLAAILFLIGAGTLWAADEIVHDAEYYIIEAQNGERWGADEKVIDQKLAEFRRRNGSRPPNIIYILLDDLGFGEIGMPGLDVIRGYSTPNINRLAAQGMSLQRMYTEPSCTPTRVAMMTGRLPIRTGLNEAKVTLTGGSFLLDLFRLGQSAGQSVGVQIGNRDDFDSRRSRRLGDPRDWGPESGRMD